MDSKLFDTLKNIVSHNNRSLNDIEKSNILPHATYYNSPLIFTGTPSERVDSRSKWFKSARLTLSDSEIVFTDPDNGICLDERFNPSEKKHWKRAPLQEVLSLADNKTLIAYHHNTRFKGGHAMEIQYWLSKLGKNALAFYWQPYSPRTFFIINPGEEIKKRIEKFAIEWSPYFTLHRMASSDAVNTHLHNRVERKSVINTCSGKVCPECGHQFTGKGWAGIDAHWKSKHEHIMPYDQAWRLIRLDKWNVNIIDNKEKV
ncbi:MAG: hypothetical protein IBX55_20400 [Methyloprofundus sp.]|nr:hypothetical protein [Methyloprofundus sp.]